MTTVYKEPPAEVPTHLRKLSQMMYRGALMSPEFSQVDRAVALARHERKDATERELNKTPEGRRWVEAEKRHARGEGPYPGPCPKHLLH